MSRSHHPSSLLFVLLVAAFCPALGQSVAPVASGVGFGQVQALPAPAPDAVESYGPDPLQRREFWLPAAPAAQPGVQPVVVLIHGGCWLNAFGVDHVRAMASALRDAGFLVMAPEYRRVGDPGGGWHGTFDDIAAALDGLSGSVLAERMDGARVAVIGHSAGGHLALWSAARDAAPGMLDPALVVGLAAITDLESYARGNSSCQTATPQLLGGMPETVPERYREVSPVLLPPGPAPRVLLQGSADAIVPQTQAQALARVDPNLEIVLVEDAGHFDMVHPGTTSFAALLDVLAPLLEPARDAPLPPVLLELQ